MYRRINYKGLRWKSAVAFVLKDHRLVFNLVSYSKIMHASSSKSAVDIMQQTERGKRRASSAKEPQESQDRRRDQKRPLKISTYHIQLPLSSRLDATFTCSKVVWL